MVRFTWSPKPAVSMLRPDQAGSAALLHAGAFAHGWSELEFERLLTSGNILGDAACVPRGTELAGFVLSRIAADEAEVLTIVVAPRWRGRGVGSDLLARHIARLARARAVALFLEVGAHNAPARALYERAGFVQVGLRKGYYPEPGNEGRSDALILRRTIA